MEPATALHGVSFRKNPRRGQKTIFDWIADTAKAILNVQLPTGYGKTFTAVGCYSILRARGQANRLLLIFPTDAQLEQFEKDGPADLADAGVSDPRKVTDIRFFGANAISHHRKNEVQVFAITAQALIQSRGMDNVRELMATGRWMVVVDEYHHYGIGKSWGEAVKALPASFLLAMSATPARPDDDSAFGRPEITVTYREAMDERAVKPLVGHSYTYRIDAVGEKGIIRSFTTDELVEEAGGSPDEIEKYRLERRMRWSPKYVSPLVSIPIERMLRERIATGHRLQALVGAMCVSHAQLVCEQIAAIFPDLSIDWVGTGPSGRPDGENRAVLNRFCPPKDEHGRRTPTLDVLVHVGMAGEGLDSVHVSEVVHLNRASKNNTNDQENGRAARFLADGRGDAVRGNVNFDSCSEYATAGYVGAAIMDAMDGNEPRAKGDADGEPEQRELEWPELPDEPTIQILDMELERIDSGGVERMKQVLVKLVGDFSESDLLDPGSRIHERALEEYRLMRTREAEAFNDKSTVKQWKESVSGALAAVAGRVIRSIMSEGRWEQSLPGDIKKRINTRKMLALGKVTEDIETLRRHYQWLKALERELIDRGVPEWLS